MESKQNVLKVALKHNTSFWTSVSSLTRCSSQTWSVSQTLTSEPANSPRMSTSLSKSWTCGSSPQTAAVSICRRWRTATGGQRGGERVHFSEAQLDLMSKDCSSVDWQCCVSLQSVLCITCMQYPTTREMLWEAITHPTARTRRWGSGTATTTPGTNSQIYSHMIILPYRLIRLAESCLIMLYAAAVKWSHSSCINVCQLYG